MQYIFILWFLSILMSVYWLLSLKYNPNKMLKYAWAHGILLVVIFQITCNINTSIKTFLVDMLLSLWALKLLTLTFIKEYGQDKKQIQNISDSFLLRGFALFLLIIPQLNYRNGIVDYKVIFSLCLMSLGLSISCVADWQLYSYKKKYPLGLLQTRLWSVVRHPNYLGENIFWFGFWACNMDNLHNYYALGTRSAGLVLYFYISYRNILYIENKMKLRYGYQNYLNQVPNLIGFCKTFIYGFLQFNIKYLKSLHQK